MSDIILFGDCLESLAFFASAGFRARTCVTSPPYFGLRDYNLPPTKWPGMAYSPILGMPKVSVNPSSCCLGLEDSIEDFIGHAVYVFRKVREVLAGDGTLWLNMGDSYANDAKWGGATGGKHAKALHGQTGVGRTRTKTGLKEKDLMGIPWRLALALQADGWYLRQDVIWNKSNAMPESAKDRCAKSHEYMFLLSKKPQYYFDHEAIKEPANLTGKGNAKTFRGGAYVNNETFDNSAGGNRTVSGNTRSARDSFRREGSKRERVIPGQTVGTHRPDRAESEYPIETRNKRSVWTVATRPYKGAHFATFPPALIEPCILAGSAPGDTVLDPFMGSGTTAQVAKQHGRFYLGCELNPKYEALQIERLAKIDTSVSTG